MTHPVTVDWYFDYLSPFAYLQRHRLDEVAAEAAITFKPVLFAGLLEKWGHKGPAEIPGKRVLTFRQAQWLADKMGVPYKLPGHHPFNPLRALRLTLALDCKIEVIKSIFDAIWVEGLLPDSDEGWQGILARLGIGENADDLINSPTVKSQLRANGEEAIANHLFGVPTFVANGHLFWGLDTTDMLLDYLSNPDFFEDPEMKRILVTEPSSRRRGQ